MNEYPTYSKEEEMEQAERQQLNKLTREDVIRAVPRTDIPTANKAMSETEAILAQRGNVHGKWTNNAQASSELFAVFAKVTVRAGNSAMPAEISEAIRMSLHKIGRIASGNMYEEDHYRDIMGYVQLALNYIREKKLDKQYAETQAVGK